ncbi:bifunctional isocitrate dehydrogenase kinase/phosphatase [Oceanimonas sp. CHS3-5]|uniref:bifunctional isocitrate dehydrogenase kinase/phosphatase n=1 Tax=Oceanimonas sp. CHS3-5 TaxID=3068186 RepID=UPI00273FE409|nr:bifunctional isocitrate dehydrogenase kinase/phosphatase [Oceanimonas sp. CHS3-5]MDP5291658.1 bifunctional isocitrate dehydrogenase kinase/phosphatase [Oceanimonas sp. CHS3-5]
MKMNSRTREMAHIVMRGFDAFHRYFLVITQGAKSRFEARDWNGVQLASRRRIWLYDDHVNNTVRAVLDYNRGPLRHQELKALKQAFNDLLIAHPNADMAESFYNSVYRRSTRHRSIRAENLYVHPFVPYPGEQDLTAVTRQYAIAPGELTGTLQRMLERLGLELSFVRLEQDLKHVQRTLAEQGLGDTPLTLTLLRPLFYRNKGAYLIGRLERADGPLPFIVPILHESDGLVLDTLLLSQDDASILFGFARAYFMVWCPQPSLLVQFLRPLLPNKSDYEIYNAIGWQKHGKTIFYRDFLQHLQHSRDQFVPAKGIKGMVMCVFTLPSFDVVFKVIKDHFTPPKTVDRATVKAKYRLVKQHDRVGRMADTMEFTNFELPLHRISPELLAELQREVPSLLTLKEDRLIIHHLYTERRMTPLNMYLEQADDEQLRNALDEYASALKQLAAANIFPGDMLFKNFGVTRHGRVIFYDYDEIAYMTECHFRDIPKTDNLQDQLCPEPWYSVGPNDVFPEEFKTFLLYKPRIRNAFDERHLELFTADYWRQLQHHIEQGRVEDIFPYRRRQRFRYRYGESREG